MFSSLTQRRLQPEIMDQPDLDPSMHHHALHGLARINRWSRSAQVMWKPILSMSRQLSGRPLEILDVACGAGDTLIHLERYAKKAGVDLRLQGCDISEVALEHARARAEKHDSFVRFFPCNVLKDEIPQKFDIVTCSLFLHHLTSEEGITLLQQMASTARRMLLLSDLIRCRTGWLLAWLGSHVLTRSKVVHVDARLSVEGAFTIKEAADLAEQAGLKNVTFQKHWPFRFLLRWERHPHLEDS